MAFLILFGLGIVTIVLHVYSMAGVSAWFGIKPLSVSIFIGKTIATFKWKEVAFNFNLIPLGGSLSYDPEDISHEESKLYSIHPWKRIVILLSGNLLLLSIVVICMGFEPMIYLCSKVLFVYFIGAIHPIEQGSVYVARMVNMLDQEPFQKPMCIVFALTAVHNLLPIPNLNGYHVLQHLFHWKTIPSKTNDLMPFLGLFFIIVIMGSWLVALTTYCLT